MLYLTGTLGDKQSYISEHNSLSDRITEHITNYTNSHLLTKTVVDEYNIEERILSKIRFIINTTHLYELHHSNKITAILPKHLKIEK